MAEQEIPSPLKGHGFTLLLVGVFGLVCAFFFVLGFIAGRSQESGIVTTQSSEEASGEAAAEDSEDLELSFFESVEEEVPPPPEASVEASAPAPPRESPVPEPPRIPAPAAPPDGDAIVLQVAALRNEVQADLLLAQIRELDLPAFILNPEPGATSRLYRVRVGPFDDSAEASRVQSLLKSEGYDAFVAN